MLWYNEPLMNDFDYDVPETWPEYLDIARDVAENHPGYYVGVIASSHMNFFWPSECAMVEEVDLGHVRIFDPEDEKCSRVAELVDELWSLDVLGVSYNNAEFSAAANEDMLLMMPWASWAGEHVFGGKENSILYRTAEGQLGVALSPKWPDQDKHWSGAIGGGAWAMSRHTKNPKLAAELITWLTTDVGFQGENATTYSAYEPAAEAWADNKVRPNPLYAFDPFPILKEAAANIWPVWTEGRFADSLSGAYGELVVNPLIAGERTVVESLPLLRERLVELAPTLGFAILDE
jgi:multiple sugar transport system substrate-binding protein